jgi:hypothetical protein
MQNLESIIRSATEDAPAQFFPTQGSGTPSVGHVVGYPGGTKTFGWSISITTTFRMARAHREKPPINASMQQLLSGAPGS